MSEPLFDTNFIQRRQNRASSALNNSSHFLVDWALKEICERLEFLTKDFGQALLHADFYNQNLLKNTKLESAQQFGVEKIRNCLISSEFLPFQKQSQNLIVSLFQMHRLNDPLGYLIQNLYALRPDGFFMAAFPGGDSLKELANSLSQTEASQKKGASLRTIPLMSKQDAGHLMQKAGFNLPVIDSETIKISYSSIEKLYTDIRMIGGGNSLTQRNKNYVGRDFFENVANYYKDNHTHEGMLEATIEIIFVSGWAPHKNQQKPLARGSADTSLTEIL